MNPTDRRNIVAAWIQDGRATDLVMASRDGGDTFSRVLVPSLSSCTGGEYDVASDPGVDFAANGRAYFSAIVVDLESATSAEEAVTSMSAFRSSDGGFSWSAPYTVQPGTGDFWDLPRLTPHPRNPKVAYYIYDLRYPPEFISGYSLMAKTTDGGKTWSAPWPVYDPGTENSWPAISKILVNDDGSLLDVMAIVASDPDNPGGGVPTEQLAIRSTDGGRTWSSPITIGRSSGVRINDPVTDSVMNAYGTFPSQTVAPNGDVYVSWPEPGDSNESSHIAVARSTDGGRRFHTTRIPVDGQGSLATVEVAGDGTVGVLYYAFAPQSDGNGYWRADVLFATSRDSGHHWKTHPVAGPFNMLTAGSNARPCCFLGDYLGIDRLPHGIAALFTMAKPVAKNNVDAYFSRITTSRPK